MKRLRWWRKPKKHSGEADPSRYFAALRNPSPHDSFPAVKGWLTRRGREADAERQHIDMPLTTMKVFLNTYKSRLAIGCIFFAVVFISCTTPVEQEETIGHMISGEIDGAHTSEATRQLSNLQWVQPHMLEMGLVSSHKLHTVTESGHEHTNADPAAIKDHRFMIALPETAESQAGAWADDLKSIEGISGVMVTPLHTTTEKPAYKVVLHSIWDDKDNLEFKPDPAQVEHAINTYLEDLEMHGVKLEQVMDEKGNVMLLKLTPPADLDKSGLSTLKQFVAEVQPLQSTNRSPEEERLILLDQYEELKAKLRGTEAGPAKEKMEAHLKALEVRIDALEKGDNR